MGEFDKRNPYFDLSRTVGLVVVCSFHYYVYLDHQSDSLWMSFGSYVLPFFFVLSGYLIHKVLFVKALSRKTLIDFYVNRCVRIFPAYFFVFFVASFFRDFSHSNWVLTYTLNIKLFLLSIDPPKIFSYLMQWTRTEIHYWSMGVEEQFYIIYPLTLLVFRKVRRLKAIVGLLLLFELCYLYLILFMEQTFYGLLLPVMGIYILWGAFFSEIHKMKVFRRIPWQGTLCFSALFLSIAFFGRDDHHIYLQFRPTGFLNLFAPLMGFLVFSFETAPIFKWTHLRVVKGLQYVGRISYGVYLIHLFWIEPFHHFYEKYLGFGELIGFLMFFTFVIAQASLMWEFLEKPLRRFRRVND